MEKIKECTYAWSFDLMCDFIGSKVLWKPILEASNLTCLNCLHTALCALISLLNGTSKIGLMAFIQHE